MKRQYCADEAAVVAAEIGTLLSPGTILTLEGLLGAGKTTLVRALLRQLGVTEQITSPTFGYVNTYQTSSGVVHHFDLYRIDSVDTFCSMGFEEYFQDQNAIVLVEWPAVIASVLARHNKVVVATLSYLPDDLEKRELVLVHHKKNNVGKK